MQSREETFHDLARNELEPAQLGQVSWMQEFNTRGHPGKVTARALVRMAAGTQVRNRGQNRGAEELRSSKVVFAAWLVACSGPVAEQPRVQPSAADPAATITPEDMRA